jgi:ketosteroid isomerase-like protein
MSKTYFLTGAEMNQQFGHFLSLGDAAGAISFYAEDAEFLGSNLECAMGKQNIVAVLERLFAGGTKQMTLKTSQVIGSGRYRILDGTYMLKDMDGTTFDTGEYSFLWIRGNEMWQLHRTIFDSLLPSLHDQS